MINVVANAVYEERNRLIVVLTKLWPSHFAIDPETTDTEWQMVVCVHSDMGQLAWHIHTSQHHLFSHLTYAPNDWDGHTTHEKYGRLSTFMKGGDVACGHGSTSSGTKIGIGAATSATTAAGNTEGVSPPLFKETIVPNKDRTEDMRYHIKGLLESLGYHTEREGLVETPRRMAAMLQEMCTREPFAFTTFDAEGMDSMVIQSNIPFASLCEHHVAPFTGLATVAYIPRDRIVGLSKLARAVHYHSRGLQTQERITQNIANMIQHHLEPVGVGVILRATHSCMSLRGVKVADTWTTTSCMKGALLGDASARAELLSLTK